MGKKITIDSSNLMNKIFELVEAQKLFNLPSHKIDIVIHPNSLVHAILELKNGLKKFIYHETSMTIPLANAIFDGDIDIEKFYKQGKSTKFENLDFILLTTSPTPLLCPWAVSTTIASTPALSSA